MRIFNPRFQRFQFLTRTIQIGLLVALAMCFFTSDAFSQEYYQSPLSWLNPVSWVQGTASSQAMTTSAYTPIPSYYTPTAYTQGAPSLPATGGSCQTQTVCYPPATQASVKYRWSYSRVERTRTVDVPVYDPVTGGLRVEKKPVTSYSLLPWLHLKPYAVASPPAVRQTASYTPSYAPSSPCFSCGSTSTYGSPSCSSCTPGSTVTTPSGSSSDGPARTFSGQTGAAVSGQASAAYPVRTQRSISPSTQDSVPTSDQRAPNGPALDIPPLPPMASRGVPVYTAAMTRPTLGAPQPPSLMETYTAARPASPAPTAERTYTAEERQEMWLRISGAKAAARAGAQE